MSSQDDGNQQAALKILLCGGIAGVVTWASVFPLDVIKTKLQAQPLLDGREQSSESQALLEQVRPKKRLINSFEVARDTYHTGGFKAFYRGLGVCSLRAFIVNAVQVSQSYS